MKAFKIVACVSLSLYFAEISTAQKVNTTERSYDLGPRCQGERITVGFQQGGFAAIHRKVGVCGNPHPDIITDKSGSIEVVGAKVLERKIYSSYLAGSNRDTVKIVYFIIEAENTGEFYIRTRSDYELVMGEVGMCPDPRYPPESHAAVETTTFKIQVIPKPPTPSLTLERYISEGTVKFRASGCPTSIPGYDYSWNTVTCLSDATNTFFPGNKDGKFEGVGGASYRVVCSANYGQCLSEPSQFERGISYTRPSDNCTPDIGKEIVKKIENIRKSDARDYHQFPGTTKICDISDTHCTVQNVFNLMLNANKYISPIPSDTRALTRPFLDLFYPEMEEPVLQCTIIDLPGLVGETVLKKGILNDPIASLTDNHRNPIMTYIDYVNDLVINYTMNDHIFAPGRVVRKVMAMCDGVFVLTIGEGKSDNEHDWTTAELNAIGGESAFKKVDERLRIKFQERYNR